MKILHLISTSVFSGAENVACQIIEAFNNDNNFDMTYCSVIGENEKCLNERKIAYLKLKRFDYISVKKAIDEYKPDIIHAHDFKAIFMAVLCAKREKIVGHIHVNHENMRTFNLKTFLMNIIFKRVSKFIWVSQSALDEFYYSKKFQDKSIVLYNAININDVYNKINLDHTEYPNYDIIFLGRLVYAKNPERLIKIIFSIKQKKNDISVAIVGDGDLKAKIQQLICQMNLTSNIKLYGFCSNPYKILSSSKILLMTSRYEGTPMCALEAMALGKPIVSTPTDGLCDIIKSHDNGFLSNDDEKIALFILKLLDDSVLYNSLSSNMKNKNKEYNNINKYIDVLKKVYKE